MLLQTSVLLDKPALVLYALIITRTRELSHHFILFISKPPLEDCPREKCFGKVLAKLSLLYFAGNNKAALIISVSCVLGGHGDFWIGDNVQGLFLKGAVVS